MMAGARAARIAALVSMLGVVSVACGGSANDAPPTPSSPVATSPDVIGPSSPVPRDAALLPESPTELPEFTPQMYGELIGQLRGVPVVVNIWASWCGPCTEEAPALSQLARAFGDRIQFIGVDILDHLAPARAFIEQYQWPYPSVFDPTGAIRDDLGFIGQPVTIVYNQVGRQIDVTSGLINEDDLAITLAAVLEV